MTEGHKEEIKVRAAYFNGMAVTAFAIAVLAPTVTMIASSPHDKPQILWVLLSVLGLCFSYGLHTTARRLARTIDQD